MLNNFAPLYVKPKHFNLGFSGTLRSLFVIFLREYFFSPMLVHFFCGFAQRMNVSLYCKPPVMCGLTFKNGVINIQTAGYNGARTVYSSNRPPNVFKKKFFFGGGTCIFM
jgi:hypothetical protein